jgi:hypothetical protein
LTERVYAGKTDIKVDENREMLKEYRGPGGCFGALGIITETRASLSV